MPLLRGILCTALYLFCHLTMAGQPPRIAIVIDDIGYQAGYDRAILAMDPRLAIAIIPESPAASRLARQAASQQREVLIHLPLAGLVHDNCQPALTCVGLDWSAGRMYEHLTEALDQVEGAVGINNHQGSRFTGDARAVGNLIDSIDRLGRHHGRALFVLDSRTVPNSLLERKALKAGLSASRRHVFLDHRNEPEAIEMAWQDLLDLARFHGSAIAIGHPRTNTIAFLNRALPALVDQNVELVPISALMRRSTNPGTSDSLLTSSP
jgi:uncharacterized protein